MRAEWDAQIYSGQCPVLAIVSNTASPARCARIAIDIIGINASQVCSIIPTTSAVTIAQTRRGCEQQLRNELTLEIRTIAGPAMISEPTISTAALEYSLAIPAAYPAVTKVCARSIFSGTRVRVVYIECARKNVSCLCIHREARRQVFCSSRHNIS